MAVTVSELFREYEADFKRLQEEINGKLQEASSSASSSKPLQEASRRASEADQALRQMDMEAKTMPTHQRAGLEPVLRQYRASLKDMRKAISQAKEEAERQALLCGGGTGTVYGKSLQERERMVQANEKVASATRQLEEARSQAFEAEQIGADVASDLRQQRETIIRARANVGEIGSNYGMAKRVIEGMQRRAEANRMLVKGIALFMVVIMAVAGYLMLGGGGLIGGKQAADAAAAGAAGGGAGSSPASTGGGPSAGGAPSDAAR